MLFFVVFRYFLLVFPAFRFCLLLFFVGFRFFLLFFRWFSLVFVSSCCFFRWFSFLLVVFFRWFSFLLVVFSLVFVGFRFFLLFFFVSFSLHYEYFIRIISTPAFSSILPFLISFSIFTQSLSALISTFLENPPLSCLNILPTING